jgi:hypothetical protein
VIGLGRKQLERVTAKIISVDCRHTTLIEIANVDYIDERTKGHKFASILRSDWEIKFNHKSAESLRNENQTFGVVEILQKALMENMPVDLVLLRKRVNKTDGSFFGYFDYIIKANNLTAQGETVDKDEL